MALDRYPSIQSDNDAYCYLPLGRKDRLQAVQEIFRRQRNSSILQHIAERFEFADNALFHTLANNLRWDEELKRWRVGTNRGNEIPVPIDPKANSEEMLKDDIFRTWYAEGTQ